MATDNTANIPTSNNLFDVLTSMADQVAALRDTIVKGKLDSNKLPKVINQYIDNISKIFERMDVLVTYLGAHAWGNVISVYGKFANAVLSTVNVTAGEFATLVEKLKGINWFVLKRAQLGINRMYFLLFGDPFAKKPKKGLMDIYATLVGQMPIIMRSGGFLNLKDPKKTILMAFANIKLIAVGLRDLVGVLSVIGLALPLLFAAQLSINILDRLVNKILRIYGRLGSPKNNKNLVQGAKTILILCGTMLFFVGTLLLIGMTIVEAWKEISLGLLGLMVCVGAMLLMMWALSKMDKDVTKGALVVLILCGAALVIAGTLFILSQLNITWDLVGAVIIMMVIMGLFVGLAIGLAALMESGIFEIGLLAILALAAIMLIVAVSFLTIVLTLMLIQKMELDEDVLLKVIKPIGALVKYVLQNIVYFNPYVLELVLVSVVLCTAIAVLSFVTAMAMWVVSKITKNMKKKEMEKCLVCVYAPFMGLARYFIENIQFFNPYVLGMTLVLVAICTVMSLLILLTTLFIALVRVIVKDWTEAENEVLFKAVYAPFMGLAKFFWDNKEFFNPVSLMLVLYNVLICLVISLAIMLTVLFVALVKVIVKNWSVQENMDMFQKVYSPVIGLMEYFWDNKKYFNPVTLYLATMTVVLTLPLILLTMVVSLITMGVIAVVKKVDDYGGWPKVQESIRQMFDVYVGKDGIIDSLNNINPIKLAKASAKFAMMLPMIETVGKMAKVIGNVARLMVPDEFDDKGKVKSYKQLAPGDFAAAAKNVATMVEFFVKVICGGQTADGTTYEGCLENLESLKKKHKEGMQMIGGMIGSIGNMADTVSKFALLQVPVAGSWDSENGCWKEYRLMNNEDFINARDNINLVAGFFVDSLCGTPGQEGIAQRVYNTFKEFKKTSAFESFRDVVDIIAGMGTSIQQFAQLMVPDTDSEYDEEKGRYKRVRPMNIADFVTASLNIQTIMTLFVNAMTEPGFVQKLKSMSKKAMENLGTIMSSIGPVCELGKLVGMLGSGKIYQGVDKDGKPFGEVDIAAALSSGTYKKNLERILLDTLGVIGGEGVVKAVANANAVAPYLSETAKNIGSAVGKLSDVIDKVSKIKNAEGASHTISTMIDNITGTITNWKLTNQTESKIAYLSSLGDVVNKMGGSFSNAANIEKGMKAYGEFLNKIDRTKLDNLKYAYSLFKALSKITEDIKGNFDKLADTLNEDIIEQLKQIAEYLDQINNGHNPVPNPVPNPKPNPSSNNPSPSNPSSNNTKDKNQNRGITAEELRTILTEVSVRLENVMEDGIGGPLKLRSRKG
ncbi:MAG: hypothetical protein IIZ78_03455 [Clostridiales bacterium]|nr:hypothetical protein [Clostridiales bacterium]